MQSLLLSGVYIASCAIVYSGVALIFGQMSKGEYNDKRRRIGEGVAGITGHRCNEPGIQLI